MTSAMRVGAVVHARMGSSRVPGKALAQLNGRPLLAWLLDRLERATELDALVVATSTVSDDDAIALWCEERGTRCERGALDDLAGRVLAAAHALDLDGLVRVNGDSPTLDQRLVDEGVRIMRAEVPDIVTNVFPRTFPVGQSVEVVRVDRLAEVHADMNASEREHVTQWFYRRPGEATIRPFGTHPPVTDVRLAVDEPGDLQRMGAILRGLGDRPWESTWADAVRLAREEAAC